MRRIAYFTAGTVGAGHLVRGVALGRALARTGVPHAYRLLSPPSPYARIASPWFSPVTVDPAALRDPRTAGSSDVARALAAFRPDVLVVDMFWVPLVHVPLPCPAWLLLRWVPPVWLAGPREAPFDASRFARTFAMEPAPGLAPFEPLPPPVVVNAVDRRPREELCRMLGADPSAPLRLVLRAGTPDDDARLHAAADALGGRFRPLALEQPDAPFPAAAWLASLQDGDVCVAGAGFNTFWESRLFGFDRHVQFVALPRRFDDQAFRIGLAQGPRPVENGADVLARALLA